MATDLRVFTVPGLPEVSQGDELGSVIENALERAGLALENGDVVVVAQKVVSKAEGAIVNLATVTPSPLAASWAAAYRKDPATMEVVLRESRRIVRMDRGILIAETHHGFVCANAGVDASNVPPGFVTALPRDPDASAARLRTALCARLHVQVATIVTDTFGRPWREGVVNVALGAAGLRPLDDYRGRSDPFGRRLQSTVIAIADELASAGAIVMGKTSGLPVAVIRGAAEWCDDTIGAGAALVRPAPLDLFR
ncbi:MAG TPA: coenzyme F420-0:L-glutamate ligase [Vicinamibacterales bacterium]|nr:coenzyme F420-0:L-glutamate ligase [Vicinamibacterales bacterium]